MNRRTFVALLGAAAFEHPAPRVVRHAPRLVERWSWVMGQPVHIQLFAESDDHGLDAAARALGELRRVEGRLSLFDDTSDLAELNRMAGRRAVRVGADLARVLRSGERLRALTGGAFNPAVEPLMRAWGFRSPRPTLPTAAELREAREAVAAAQVRIGGGAVFLPGAATRLDLGGIGVGYGLDRAGDVLRAAGVRRALIDISGDCLAIGAPPGEPAWMVAIAAPATRGTMRRVVPLRDAALATSSNLESFVTIGAVRAGHVMDPATGRPAGARAQVTVLAPGALAADALSTAALISGEAGPGGRLV